MKQEVPGSSNMLLPVHCCTHWHIQGDSVLYAPYHIWSYRRTFFFFIDIDECAASTHDCGQGQLCINRVGGYICQCPSGHVVNERKECVDVDECTKFAGQVSEDLALLY